jgi:hypothetical protein
LSKFAPPYTIENEGGAIIAVAKEELAVRSTIFPTLIASLFCALGFPFLSPSLLAAPEHVVSPAELQQAAVAAARTRQANVAVVQKFFSTPQAEKALKSAHLDPVQIQRAVPALSSQELARLAAKAGKAQKDFAAGALTNQQITYILIAIGTAVVVLILVH